MKQLKITGVVAIPDDTFAAASLVSGLKAAIDTAAAAIGNVLGEAFAFEVVLSTRRGPAPSKGEDMPAKGA